MADAVPSSGRATRTVAVAVLSGSGVSSRSSVIQAVRHLVAPPAVHRVAFCASWAELEAVAAGERPYVILIESPKPEGDAGRFVQLRGVATEATIVAMVDATATGALCAVEYLRHGADDVFVRSDPAADPPRLAAVLESALGRRVTAVAGSSLALDVPQPIRSYLEQLWVRCCRPVGLEEARGLYHRHGATLNRHLRSHRLPPVSQLVAWGRLFHTGYVLVGSRLSVDQVAALLDYPSRGALLNQLRRHANITPALLRRGGLRLLTDEFSRRHEADRWELYDLKVG